MMIRLWYKAPVQRLSLITNLQEVAPEGVQRRYDPHHETAHGVPSDKTHRIPQQLMVHSPISAVYSIATESLIT